MNIAYLTIESDISSEELQIIPSKVVEEFTNLDIELIENTEYCFVLKIIYDDYDELQELASTTSYLLLSASINRYTTTLNCETFL